MQVVMNKYFFLNLEKKFGAYLSWSFQENAKKKLKTAPLIPKNDVTEPKARLLY